MMMLVSRRVDAGFYMPAACITAQSNWVVMCGAFCAVPALFAGSFVSRAMMQDRRDREPRIVVLSILFATLGWDFLLVIGPKANLVPVLSEKQVMMIAEQATARPDGRGIVWAVWQEACRAWYL